MADTRALVSDSNFNTLYVLDLTTSTILATFTPSTPGEIAVLPNATEAYITNNGAVSGVLYTVALPANTLGTSVTVGAQPTSVAASPDGTHVYSASASTGTITPVATPSNVAGAGITTGASGVTGIAIDPAGANLYADTTFDGIVPIAIPANTVGAGWGNPPLPNNTQYIVVMPDGIHGYTVHGQFVYPLDLIAQTVGSPITTTLTGSLGIFLTPSGSQIWIPDTGSNQVVVVDTATNLQIAAITLSGGSSSQSGGFDHTGATFYVPDIASGNIYSIDTASFVVGGTPFHLGGNPRFLAVVPTPSVPPTPPYPGSQFIPKLFIPQKGKVTVDYTQAELMANWIAIETWSQRWEPPAPVALFFPSKNSTSPTGLNANWIGMENWVNQINQREKAPYPDLFIPRKNSNQPFDLDVNFLRIQNWANSL
jgi:YVTN family beta-propeller protein